MSLKVTYQEPYYCRSVGFSHWGPADGAETVDAWMIISPQNKCCAWFPSQTQTKRGRLFVFRLEGMCMFWGVRFTCFDVSCCWFASICFVLALKWLLWLGSDRGHGEKKPTSTAGRKQQPELRSPVLMFSVLSSHSVPTASSLCGLCGSLVTSLPLLLLTHKSHN